MACSLYQAVWGVMTLSRPRSGCGSGSGFGVSRVISAHPAICFASSTRASASVSTIGPRLQLISTAVGFIRTKASSLIIFLVCGVSGGWTERKSDSRSTSGNSIFLPGHELPL